MIDWVHFENFKSLADVTIDLGRFTVLVGPNGCGKSSVLRGLRLHSMAGDGSLGGTEPQSRLGRFGTEAFVESLPLPDAARVADQPVAFVARNAVDELGFRFRRVEQAYEVDVWVTGAAGGLAVTLPSEWGKALAVLNDPRVRAFDGCAYMRPRVDWMAFASVPEEVRPVLRETGSNLSSVLAWMKGADEDRLAAITDDVSRVVPGVRRIRTTRTKIREYFEGGRSTERIADSFELEFRDGRSVPASLLSEGTVLTLGVLTMLHEPHSSRVFLIDDIDRGLHLTAQASLVEVLRRVLAEKPGLQIVCTSHSPYLLDLFKPEEVRVMALDSERRTRVRALSDHPDIEQWKFGTQTGELWATLGEAWVLEAGGG